MEKGAGAGVSGDESSSTGCEGREAPERLGRRIADLEQLIAAERTARTRAENANRLKDDFLARLSHELRTPLSSMLTWCRVLEARCGKGDELLRRGLSAITANAMQQSQLISGLLDISRIATGKLRLKLVACDLRDLLENALLSHRPIAEAKHLDLQLEPCPQPVRVRVDAMRCGQVLGNLLANAIKFTPEGGTVTAGVRQTDRRAEVYVRDTGMGISSELLPHVFDRYRQARAGAGRRFGGLGLGLAIVKELVDLHGGTVRVESAGEGCGATFFVQLPCEDEAAPAELERENSSPEAAELPAGQPLQGLRILVVEDDASALESLDLMLTEYGAQVSGVSSAPAALEALQHSGHFQLLLSDLGLAPTDGFELIAMVRRVYPSESLPAIAVTAFAREEDRARAMSVGFQAYVTKPYDVGVLVVTAQRLGRGAGAP